jgi:hypothetical protein
MGSLMKTFGSRPLFSKISIKPTRATTSSRQNRREAMIGYDAKTLYIAFHCYDEPGKIRATVAKRDQIFDEDNVRIYLDTYNDQRRAYLLGWNPLGVQADGIMTEGAGTDFNVDIVMESKGTLTSDGWTLEVAIPFKSLRYEAGKGKLWGIQIWRNIDRLNDEIDSWMPNSRDISSLLSQEGHITGLEGISTEHTLEIIPSITVSKGGKRVNALTAEQRAANPNLLDRGRFENHRLVLNWRHGKVQPHTDDYSRPGHQSRLCPGRSRPDCRHRKSTFPDLL